MHPGIGLSGRSDYAWRRASANTEVFHELPVILVDHFGHVIGPMIIAFVQLAAKGFQSLFTDRHRWFRTGRFTNLRAGPRPGWVRRHNISLTTLFRREPEPTLLQSE